MIDLDEALHDDARRWSATAHEPPALEDAMRSVIRHDRRPPRWVAIAAAAAVVVLLAAVAIMISRRDPSRPDSQPAVTESPTQHLRTSQTKPRPSPTTRTTQPTPVSAITPFPTVTALPMTATDLKRATYWGRKYVELYRATATGAPARTRLVAGGTWPKDVVRVEAIIVSIRDGGRLFGDDLTGGALPTASNKVIVLHLVGRFFVDGELSLVNGHEVPRRRMIRSIMATIGINGGQYDALSDPTNAHSGPIVGATQLVP